MRTHDTSFTSLGRRGFEKSFEKLSDNLLVKDALAFADAFERKDTELIVHLLKKTDLGKAKCIPIITKKHGKRMRNCFEIAAREGNIEMCRALANGKLDVNHPDKFKTTPYTSAFEHRECLEFLFSIGGRVPGDTSEQFDLNEQKIAILKYNMKNTTNVFGKEKIQFMIRSMTRSMS